jgi:hypothetical protein
MPLLTGRALPGLQPHTTKTFNSVYRGDVLLDNDDIERGFLKDLDPRQLANELLVGVLGQALGVAVPDIALVLVTPDISKEFKKVADRTGAGKVAFFSFDANAPTVAQILSAGGGLPPTLKSSPTTGQMYGFDTWVANVDRHRNNILLSGAGKAFLIDHGHCFTGPEWKKEQLNAAKEYPTPLAGWLTPQLSDQEKSQAISDVLNLVKTMIKTDVHAAMSDALSEQLYGSEDSDALLGFLEGRIQHVEKLAAASLGILV